LVSVVVVNTLIILSKDKIECDRGKR
jgi:hypothetical protein